MKLLGDLCSLLFVILIATLFCGPFFESHNLSGHGTGPRWWGFMVLDPVSLYDDHVDDLMIIDSHFSDHKLCLYHAI